MRIDKMMSDMGLLSRKACAVAVRRGQITLNGVPVRSPSVHVDPTRDTVTLDGETVRYAPYVYVMLNKPEGYVSATDDRRLPCVTELLPEELQRRELFPVGRLDRDTVGLMVLTNDGQLSHALLSPRRHVAKAYRFSCESPLCISCEQRFLEGVDIGDYVTKPAELLADADRLGGVLVITEGKYHQVKRMLAAVDNRIVTLERVRFGPLQLDAALSRGQWRWLTDAEVDALRDAVNPIYP